MSNLHDSLGAATPPLRPIAEYPLPHAKLVIALQGEPPAWVEPTLQKLGELLRLPANWNSYGARPVDPACAWAAMQLLLAVLGEDSPIPSIVPTVQGGVQVEWHLRGVDLEIEVHAPDHVQVSFADLASGEMHDDALVDRERLRAYIDRLSPRHGGVEENGA